VQLFQSVTSRQVTHSCHNRLHHPGRHASLTWIPIQKSLPIDILISRPPTTPMSMPFVVSHQRLARFPPTPKTKPSSHVDLNPTPPELPVPMRHTLMTCPVCFYPATHRLPAEAGMEGAPAPACTRCSNAFRQHEERERRDAEVLTSFPALLEPDAELRGRRGSISMLDLEGE
jgi:hypothetical protein